MIEMAEKRKSTNKPNNYKRAKYSGGGGASKVEVGMRGFLISHDRNKEKFCRIDSFRLLNHFANELYGPETSIDPESPSEKEDQDIENALKNEVTQIKAKSEMSAQKFHRFSTVKSGCNNLIFVKCRDLIPSHLVSHILKTLTTWENMDIGDMPRTRNVLRMHPVDFTCPGYLDAMCKMIPPFLMSEFDKFVKEDSVINKEYTIEYKCRNNNHISRQEVLNEVTGAMKELVPTWKYNCRSQGVFVLIDIVRTVSMVAVVRDYFRLKKFNVREIFLQKTTDKIKADKDTDMKISEQDNEGCKDSTTDKIKADKGTDIKTSEQDEDGDEDSTTHKIKPDEETDIKTSEKDADGDEDSTTDEIKGDDGTDIKTSEKDADGDEDSTTDEIKVDGETDMKTSEKDADGDEDSNDLDNSVNAGLQKQMLLSDTNKSTIGKKDT